MDVNTPSIKTAIQVLKTASQVFNAIVNPDEMSNYFISKGSARIEDGATILWSFPEFEGEFPVVGGKVVPNELVSFLWDTEEGAQTLVEISLKPTGETATLVTVTEKAEDGTNPGLKWLTGNTEGWANFLACLKAWLEYGIHLRRGAFDYMQVQH
jgi:uncharacterized protein YndB with AHSA1/START domain